MKLVHLFEQATPNLRWGSKFLAVTGLAETAEEAYNDLEEENTPTDKAIKAVLVKMLGQGNSVTLELKDAKLKKPNYSTENASTISLVYRLEHQDLDGDQPQDISCTLEY
jgi:hypothetical protein